MATTTHVPSTVTNAYLDEPRELERIIARLLEQYPAAGERVVRDVVATSVHVFDGAPVRKFVPLLVERLARQALNQRRVIDLDEPAG